VNKKIEEGSTDPKAERNDDLYRLSIRHINDPLQDPSSHPQPLSHDHVIVQRRSLAAHQLREQRCDSQGGHQNGDGAKVGLEVAPGGEVWWGRRGGWRRSVVGGGGGPVVEGGVNEEVDRR
jgi:hypothetical protein